MWSKTVIRHSNSIQIFFKLTYSKVSLALAEFKFVNLLEYSEIFLEVLSTLALICYSVFDQYYSKSKSNFIIFSFWCYIKNCV